MLARTLERLETLRRVDGPARAVQWWYDRVLPDHPRVSASLRGSWFGHPLHPMLVLAPVGAWLSAGVLDAVPGQQPAARRMVLVGVLTAVPAVVTGAVEYRQLAGRERRVAFIHMLANVVATTSYLASYGRRRRGDFLGGRLLGLVGLAAVGTGGTIGGHLTYGQGVGVYRWQPLRAEPRPAAPSGAENRVPAGSTGSERH